MLSCDIKRILIPNIQQDNADSKLRNCYLDLKVLPFDKYK